MRCRSKREEVARESVPANTMCCSELKVKTLTEKLRAITSLQMTELTDEKIIVSVRHPENESTGKISKSLCCCHAYPCKASMLANFALFEGIDETMSPIVGDKQKCIFTKHLIGMQWPQRRFFLYIICGSCC